MWLGGVCVPPHRGCQSSRRRRLLRDRCGAVGFSTRAVQARSMHEHACMSMYACSTRSKVAVGVPHGPPPARIIYIRKAGRRATGMCDHYVAWDVLCILDVARLLRRSQRLSTRPCGRCGSRRPPGACKGTSCFRSTPHGAVRRGLLRGTPPALTPAVSATAVPALSEAPCAAMSPQRRTPAVRRSRRRRRHGSRRRRRGCT